MTLKSFGPDPSPVDGVTSTQMQIPVRDWNADFLALPSAQGSLLLTDITCPSDQPLTVRLAQRVRPNVYAGTSIDKSVYLPSIKGTDTIVEVNATYVITDDAGQVLHHYPVKAALSITVPTSGFVSVSDMKNMFGYALAGYFGTPTEEEFVNNKGLEAISHGVLTRP